MLCTEIDFDIQNNLCTQHVIPMFCKNKSFWQRFNCISLSTKKKSLWNSNVCTLVENWISKFFFQLPTYTKGSENRSTKFVIMSQLIWGLQLMPNQVRDYFKYMWPLQNVRSLKHTYKRRQKYSLEGFNKE